MEPSRGGMIPALDPDPESDSLLFGDSGSGFFSIKKRNSITYTGRMGWMATGNGNKLRSSQAQLGQATHLAVT